MTVSPTAVYPPPTNTPAQCCAIQIAAIDTAAAAWDPAVTEHDYQLPLGCTARSAERVADAYRRAGWDVSKTYVDGAGWQLTFRALAKG